ncbi:MAG: cupin domain-containing protein [Rhodanobacter sp.]
MRLNTAVSIGLAFLAGLVLSPVAQRAMADARAQAAPLQPAMIDLMALKHGDLPKTSNPEMTARSLVVTDHATIGIQSGNVAKHLHAQTTEIQYIIEGRGAMWLGNERREFKPGTLIIIPSGTAHGGTLVTEGPVKALAIKIPPQPKGDIQYLN